jgi:hypothetical protein
VWTNTASRTTATHCRRITIADVVMNEVTNPKRGSLLPFASNAAGAIRRRCAWWFGLSRVRPAHRAYSTVRR